MSRDDILWVIQATKMPETCPLGTVWYVFGSVLSCGGINSDIDILIVYENWEQVILARERMGKLEMERAIDLLFMMHEEEAEKDFIRSERCIEIFPTCSVSL